MALAALMRPRVSGPSAANAGTRACMARTRARAGIRFMGPPGGMPMLGGVAALGHGTKVPTFAARRFMVYCAGFQFRLENGHAPAAHHASRRRPRSLDRLLHQRARHAAVAPQ